MIDQAVYAFLVGDNVPLHEGLLTLVAFLAIGFFCAWGNGRKIPLSFIMQFCYATLIVRYIQSYVMFHHSMREGIWPFFWITAAFIGIWLARPRAGTMGNA